VKILKRKKKTETGKKSESSTKVKEIECIKNVIIIRKLYDEKEKSQGEQKAIAGHAVYDVKTGKITLSDNPSLVRGSDTLRGEVIVYWVDSERVSVRSGRKNTSELKIRSNQK
jgi:lipopolysaccharide transport protein LptA